MIKIALCDDNDRDLIRLQQKVETILQEVFPLEKYSLIIFHSPVDLEYDIQTSDVADIFILDVEMPEINGFQIVKKIHDRNAAAVVFFFTAHMEMASKGYS